MTQLTFLRAWLSLRGAATPSQGPSLMLITKKKPISPHFQTLNDSIIRLVMRREIVCVYLGTCPEPVWVKAPPARVCLQDVPYGRQPISVREAVPPGKGTLPLCLAGPSGGDYTYWAMVWVTTHNTQTLLDGNKASSSLLRIIQGPNPSCLN